MKKYFSIGEAAKAVHTTTETLRHYDRIGLVKPSKKDEWTGYRYYTENDIVRLNTVRALLLMDLSLSEIKNVLEYDDLEKTVEFLEHAEEKADEKIAALESSKAKIRLARSDYEKKLDIQRMNQGYASEKSPYSFYIKTLPERVILLSDTLQSPTLENLWNYLSHFYEKLTPKLKDCFSFEDVAGIYTESDLTRMFAVCTKYKDVDNMKILPQGKYLCADCNEENRADVLKELLKAARDKCGVSPSFSVQMIVISGILHWNYETQIYIGNRA